MKKFVFSALLGLFALTASAADYDVLIENMPKGCSVNIAGQSFMQTTPILAREERISAENLSREQIETTETDGWHAFVSIDNANRQLTISYQQLFEPAESATDSHAKSYYIYEAGSSLHVKYEDGNIVANSFTGDKFVFIENQQNPGTYYIYNQSAGHYIYYTIKTGLFNTKYTSLSSVKYTEDLSSAKSWRIVDDGDGEHVDIIPGEVTDVTETTQGWNFRGGADYVLNLYDRSDVNSKWMFLGQLSASVNCPTHLFAEPGNPFMHKLLPLENEEIVGVEGLPDGLELRTDRSYKYIYGHAPKTEGTYTYSLLITDHDGVEKPAVEVRLDVSSHLTQPRPFMGLLTWNAFDTNINTDAIKKLSDALVSYGLTDLGYRYMCIDDHWAESSRSSDGKLQISNSKFNGSFADVVNHIHNNGQKIGIYSDAGTYTCSKAQPGSYGYEESDAQQFIGWGFDLLKYDYCYASQGTTPKIAEQAYMAMGQAIDKAVKAAGKQPEDFLYYMCEWGWRSPWIWGAETGATCWRVTDDTRDFWSDTKYNGGILQSIAAFKKNWMYQGVNRWNDADMLLVGLHGTGYASSNGGGIGVKAGLTVDECKTNFALWCMWGSPLTLSNNITNLDGQKNTLTGKTVTNQYYKEDLAIITNKELIKIDQDILGQGGEPVIDESTHIVFTKDLADGDVAVSITNLDSSTRLFSIPLRQIPGIESGKTYQVLDLWDDAKDVGRLTKSENYGVELTSHNTAVIRLHDTTYGLYGDVFGDLNDDREVNLEDVAIMLDVLLGRKTVAKADLNRSGTFTIADLTLLLTLVK